MKIILLKDDGLMVLHQKIYFYCSTKYIGRIIIKCTAQNLNNKSLKTGKNKGSPHVYCILDAGVYPGYMVEVCENSKQNLFSEVANCFIEIGTMIVSGHRDLHVSRQIVFSRNGETSKLSTEMIELSELFKN